MCVKTTDTAHLFAKMLSLCEEMNKHIPGEKHLLIANNVAKRYVPQKNINFVFHSLNTNIAHRYNL